MGGMEFLPYNKRSVEKFFEKLASEEKKAAEKGKKKK